MGSLWYEGANPTADLCVFANDKDLGPVVLRIVRGAGAEEGKCALPGGFLNTSAKAGGKWDDSQAELPAKAAVREVEEETGVAVDPSRVVEVGVYEGGGRDPRDSASAWTRSHAFAVVLTDGEYAMAKESMSAGDDAVKADFEPLEKVLAGGMAFDHGKILKDASARMGFGAGPSEGSETPAKLSNFSSFVVIYAGAFAGFGVATGLATRLAASDGVHVAAGFAAGLAGAYAARRMSRSPTVLSVARTVGKMLTDGIDAVEAEARAAREALGISGKGRGPKV